MTRALLTAGLLLLLCRPFGPGLSAAAGDAVISLDYRGERLQRLVQDPTLRVFSDGSVLMPQIYAHSKSYRYQMAPDEVQELLDFMQAEGFFGADFVAPRPTAAPPGHDASITLVYAARGGIEGRYAVRDLDHHPGARGLQRVVDRLERLMSLIKLGGEEAAGPWLERANAELHALHPQRPALTLEDLLTAALRVDGSASVVFARAADGTRVSISTSADGRSAVAVLPAP